MSLLQGARLAQSFGEKSREKQIEIFYPEGECDLNVRISLMYVACVQGCVCEKLYVLKRGEDKRPQEITKRRELEAKRET